MKTSRRPTSNVVDMPHIDSGMTATATQVSDEHIAPRAFELYSARGYEDGHDLDDWFQAERDLRGDIKSPAA